MASAKTGEGVFSGVAGSRYGTKGSSDLCKEVLYLAGRILRQCWGIGVWFCFRMLIERHVA
jgi:hypothetical protein